MRESSRGNWSSADMVENIKTGCLQRIADATEVMAKNHLKLQEDYEHMKGARDHYRGKWEIEKRRSPSYRGQITKLKKKLKK